MLFLAVTEGRTRFIPVPVQGHVAATETIVRITRFTARVLLIAFRRTEERGNHLTYRAISRSGPRRRAAFNIVDKFVVKSGLFEIRQHDAETGKTSISAITGILLINDLLRSARQKALNVMKVLSGQPELFEVIGTLHTSRRFARGLDGGEKQTDQDTDNSDNDQKFNQGKTLTRRIGSHNLSSSK